MKAATTRLRPLLCAALLASAAGYAPTAGCGRRAGGAAPSVRCSVGGPLEPPRAALSAQHLIEKHLEVLGGDLGVWAERSRGIKCPFFRRRAGDAVEAAAAVFAFVVARHKSLWPEPADLLPADLLPGGSARDASKQRGLSLEAVMGIVAADIEHGQYYVSGRLTPTIYDERCFFDGPDPDMPVRSLQRYTDALRGLFDPARSRIELLSMEPRGERAFAAHWRLSGALKLPWRPAIKPYVGSTLYELGDDGLIASHTEAWSISVLDAFVSTFLPAYGAPPAPGAAALRSGIAVEPPEPRLRPSCGAAAESGAAARSELVA